MVIIKLRKIRENSKIIMKILFFYQFEYQSGDSTDVSDYKHNIKVKHLHGFVT